jgi:hypothetical protein
MSIPPRALIILLGLLVMVLTGARLTHAGSPYPVLGLTLHKLVSLGVIVLLVNTATQVHRLSPLDRSAVTATAITVALFLWLAATGGLLSGKAQVPRGLKVAHHVASYIATVTTGVALYLLLTGM